MKSTLLDAKLPMSRAETVVNPTFCVWSISHWHGLSHHNQVWDNCCWCTWRQINKHIPKNAGHAVYIVPLDGAAAAGLPELRLHLLWHRIWRCWEQRGRKIPIQDKFQWIHILFLAISYLFVFLSMKTYFKNRVSDFSNLLLSFEFVLLFVLALCEEAGEARRKRSHTDAGGSCKPRPPGGIEPATLLAVGWQCKPVHHRVTRCWKILEIRCKYLVFPFVLYK